MKFVKIETGFGGWDEYTDAGQFVQHLSNYEHYRIVNEMIAHRASDWFQHFSLWYTHHSQYQLDYIVNSLFN